MQARAGGDAAARVGEHPFDECLELVQRYSCRLLALSRASIIRGSVACEFTPSSSGLPARSAAAPSQAAMAQAVRPCSSPRRAMFHGSSSSMQLIGNARQDLAQVSIGAVHSQSRSMRIT